MKKLRLIFCFTIALTFISFITGCGEDDVNDISKPSDSDISKPSDIESLQDDQNDLESLYKELVGEYDLFKAEITHDGKPKEILEPPTVSGTMTITSNQKITQDLEVDRVSVTLTGTFEILPDERVVLIDNEGSAIISKATYTWNGKIFTTTLDAGTFIEKDFWRKQ